MFILGNFLMAFAKVLNIGFTLYMWLVIARAVLSWVSPDPYNPIVQFIHRATDPVMDRLRQMLPLSVGGIDFSPVIVIMLIVFAQEFVVNSLMTMGMMMGR